MVGESLPSPVRRSPLDRPLTHGDCVAYRLGYMVAMWPCGFDPIGGTIMVAGDRACDRGEIIATIEDPHLQLVVVRWRGGREETILVGNLFAARLVGLDAARHDRETREGISWDRAR